MPFGIEFGLIVFILLVLLIMVVVLFMFYRANIDEVESEVVEIEAKLDKVRDLTKYVSITFRFPIWSDHQVPVFPST